MADNPPATPAPNPGPRPTLPAGTGLTGRLKNPTTRLPVRTGGAGKIVVMLSSVAKPPPAGTQALPRVASPTTEPAPKPAPPGTSATVDQPPPLPPAQVSPANKMPSPTRPQLSATTYVKLPPKTAVPGWSSLSGKPAAPPLATPAPVSGAMPPVVMKTPEPKKVGAQHIPPIKLNQPVAAPVEPAEESIFVPKQQPEAKSEIAKKPEPLTPAVSPAPQPVAPLPPVTLPVAKAPEGDTVSLDLFEKSQVPSAKPAPPVAEVKESPAPLVAPPLLPPQKSGAPPAKSEAPRPVRPPPLPLTLTKPMSAPSAPAVVEEVLEPIHEKPLPPIPEPVKGPAPTDPQVAAKSPVIVPAPQPEKLPPPLEKAAESPVPPTPALHVAPPMLEKAPEPVVEKLPPPLEQVTESPAPPPHAMLVAPPMLEQPPEPPAEKLPQPHLPVEARKAEVEPDLPESPGVQKAPAMIRSETGPVKAPAAPSQPRRSITSWLKKTAPLVVSSSSPKPPAPPIAEAKPALKPAVLPSRSLLIPTPVVEPPALTPPASAESTPMPKADAVEEGKKLDEVKPAATAPHDPATASPVITSALEAVVPAVVAGTVAKEKVKSTPKAEPVPPHIPDVTKKKAAVPLTRAERAKRRRFLGLLFFWVGLFPATIALLFWASLHFGRDTRVEGQIIPPPGTVLSNEVWVVTDFRSLASGITEDLAAERMPLMQEIQERQDHLQRAQADVAAREERIRLIQEEISAAKAEIDTTVKQARDATQQIWDVDGAAVDSEYASRMDQLRRTIADRAKSLNLKYEPDATFNSPEVWANAYRLALYQVPTGVDSVKEHAWLADQMKQWRDFQKSMDDRTEQLREKAAQIKLGPAPKITDLNTKIDDLQQRVDGTEAEEVPLKAELQQAQDDLVQAQSSDAGLDDKYYKQLYSLPGEAVTKHIPLKTNGRFTWLEDDVFVEGEMEHHYWIFARATRTDGRQYWALLHFGISKNQTCEMYIEPSAFISTKAILRPSLSPDEQEQ